MKPIQMVDLQSQYIRYKSDMDAAVIGSMTEAKFIQGPEVRSFESNLAEFLGVKHVISCANGTDALQLAFMALGLKAGDEVIIPSFAYAALPEVLLLLGIKPVYVEVNPITFLMDYTALESLITPNTKAIAPVHLFGCAAPMKQILQIARKHNLFVVEDGAQSLGAQYCSDEIEGFASCLADIGTTSFFPSKNLGCYGDGGAVFTNNDEWATTLRMLANHGQIKKYHHQIIGLNSRLDTLQAAILNVKLPHLKEFNLKRLNRAQRYNEAFENLSQLITPVLTDDSSHVFHQYTLKLNGVDREDFKQYLESKGIPTMVYYPIPLHKQNAYANGQSLPISEALAEKVISLPICPELDNEQQDYIIEHVKTFFKA